MKQKHQYCLALACHNTHSTPAPHVFLGLRKCLSGEAMEEAWRCERCGYEHQASIPKRRCHKRTWPYYNDSAGVTFESESHEQKHCAAHGLTPINK
jgi:hypothetical protein